MDCDVYGLAVSDSLVYMAVSARLLDEEKHNRIRRDYEVYNIVI